MVGTIFSKLSQIQQENIPAALCIVTKIQGSAPGKPGMKMIVFENGTIDGTVGGGAIEKDVIDKAIEIMQTCAPGYFEFNLKDDLGMSCGGHAEVYIEPVNQKNKLYIFGGGHIGKALSVLSKSFGFEITVIDERPGIFNSYESSVYSLWNIDYKEAVEKIQFDKRSFFVLVTHKHVNDEAILRLLCNKTYAYLGMIGSRTKVAIIKKHLVDDGLITDEKLQQIDSPIGLKFKAITPDEIAVSILAKLIDVKNSF